jgi:hypothetical protein
MPRYVTALTRFDRVTASTIIRGSLNATLFH